MNIESGEKKINLSIVSFCFSSFTYGLSLTIHMQTEFFYFRDTMELNTPELYYGLSMGALYGSGCISSFLASIYYDKVKKVRTIFLCVSCLSILGNICYLLYFSPWVVLFGQVLVGFGGARVVLATAEIARVYTSAQLTRMISLLVICISIGAALGPASAYVFNLIDTHIGIWKLNINNTVGVVMGALYVIGFVLYFFTLTDLPLEHHIEKNENYEILKESTLHDSTSDIHSTSYLGPEGSKHDDSFKEIYFTALKALLSNKFARSLYFLSSLRTFITIWTMGLTPITSSRYLHWTQVNIAVVNLVCVGAATVPTTIVIRAMTKYVKDVDILLYSILTSILSLLMFMLYPYMMGNEVMTAFIYISCLFRLSCAVASQIQSRAMLAKMVPNEIQGITEAIRNGLFEAAKMIAGLTIQFAAHNMVTCLSSFLVISVASFAWVLYYRQDFIEMKVISI